MLARHGNFLAAFGFGAVLAALSALQSLPVELWVMIGADGFFLCYLLLSLLYTQRTGPDDLRRHSEAADEGLALIVVLAATAVGLSLASIVMVLNGHSMGWPQKAAALASVPLGWSMVQTLAAFRYAHLFYAADANSAGGLNFPGTFTPGPWEFLYLAFGIGMTAQVADVQVTETLMRRAVLGHSVLAFFYNAVILALAVNAAMKWGQ